MNEETTIDVKDKNVFLCGPMTGLPNYNIAAFMDAHAELMRLGARVSNPALSWMKDGCPERPHEELTRRSLHELTAPKFSGSETGNYYDVLVLLPGWRESDGACMEVSVAGAIGIPVVKLDKLVGNARESQ